MTLCYLSDTKVGLKPRRTSNKVSVRRERQTPLFAKVSRGLKPCGVFRQSVAKWTYELSAKILIVFNLVRAPATFLEYSFVAFEILILNLSSSRFFLASALKLNQLQSAHCPWLQSSGESDTCITSFFIPPSPNNNHYYIGQPLLQLFIRGNFQTFGLRWCCRDEFFCRLKFCSNSMDPYYFAYLSMTSI